MKIADMSEEKLNYLVAKSLNRQWHYSWLLSKGRLHILAKRRARLGQLAP